MYLLKRLFLLVLFQLFGSVLSVSAQVVTTVGGYPVVDLSDFTPFGCVLSFKEASTRRISMNAQTPSNSVYLSVGSAVSGEAGTWNAKMSIRYQLMSADHTVGATDWANAYTQCKRYSGEGGTPGQWRLPTQREFIMILVLHPQLLGFTSFDASSYWSSTEDTTDNAWCVTFYYGATHDGFKGNSNRVRCVRDL